ncbi:MAG: sulfotransferase [Flavobacteriales bacterium]|nr:MAG: sulfotransferase [Flavobacteriales bacterium]
MDSIRGTRSPFAAHAAFGADIRALSTTLFKFGRSVPIAYWPRVLAITGIVALNAPLRWWESLRYGAAIKRSVVRSPVFILGHPRSGTTYLHYVMGRDPQFASPAVYEALMPWTFLSAGGFLRRMLGKALPATRPMDNVKMTADAPKEEEFALACMGSASLVTGYFFPRRLPLIFNDAVLLNDTSSKSTWQGNVQYFTRKLSLKYPGKALLMKSPANTARVKELLELFPDARFIHIHRDPLTVYASTMKLYSKILPQQALGSMDRTALRDFVLKSYSAMQAKYEADRAGIPAGRLVEIRYADFVGNEMAILERIYSSLGLDGFNAARPHMEAEISASKDYETNKYNLGEEEVRMVKQAWGLP